MKKRKAIAAIFILIALVLGIIFFLNLSFPVGLAGYVKKEYYNQFGPLAICIELLVAGYYLFKGHQKANFTLALFAFTILLDVFFNLIGLFTSIVPAYATFIFLACAGISLWLAFSNAFNLGRITLIAVLGSFILGNAVELFFNFL